MPHPIPPSKMHHPIPFPSGRNKSNEFRRNRRRRENLDLTRTCLTEADIGVMDKFLSSLRILIEFMLLDSPIFVRHLPRFNSYAHRRIFILHLADEIRVFEDSITNEVEIRIKIVIKKWFGIPLTDAELEMDQDPIARKARVFIARNFANQQEQPLPDKWEMWRDLGAKLPPVPLSNINLTKDYEAEMNSSTISNKDCKMVDKNENDHTSSKIMDSQAQINYVNENDINIPTVEMNIIHKDLWRLDGNNWLNDDVINSYLELLVKRSEQNSNLPKVYAFSTFFYPKLTQMGFATVKKWTKKVNIFSYQMLLIPIHLGNHWCMAIVDFEHQRIDYYDSLLGNNQECLNILNDYLNQESLDKRDHPFDTYNWAFTCRNDIPIQNNLSDCGVFACIYAEYLSRGAEINFTQENIQYFREKMAYEIKQNKMQ